MTIMCQSKTATVKNNEPSLVFFCFRRAGHLLENCVLHRCLVVAVFTAHQHKCQGLGLENVATEKEEAKYTFSVREKMFHPAASMKMY